MAYGITGAGKTYTMLGNTMEVPHSNYFPTKDYTEIKGISVLAMNYLFKSINTTPRAGPNFNPKDPNSYQQSVWDKIKISYLEVYNEQIRDLLREDKGINLIILEDAKRGIIVPGLKE
jgi:hypothetical protein